MGAVGARPGRRRGWRTIPAVLLGSVLAFTAAGCGSPEAARSRGGGPGADIGNRVEVVEFHAGARPYHGTPCVTEPWVECTGPEPVFGTPIRGE